MPHNYHFSIYSIVVNFFCLGSNFNNNRRKPHNTQATHHRIFFLRRLLNGYFLGSMEYPLNLSVERMTAYTAFPLLLWKPGHVTFSFSSSPVFVPCSFWIWSRNELNAMCPAKPSHFWHGHWKILPVTCWEKVTTWKWGNSELTGQVRKAVSFQEGSCKGVASRWTHFAHKVGAK